MKALISAATLLALAALLMAGVALWRVETQSERVVETKVEYRVPERDELCLEAWEQYAGAQTDRVAHTLYRERVVPLCGLGTLQPQVSPITGLPVPHLP